MAWTTPITISPGGPISASDHNTYVRDNLIYLHAGRPASSVARNNGSDYSPTDSWADIDATNLAFTLSLTTGRVIITAECTFQAATGDSMDCFLDVAVDGTRVGGTNGITVDGVTHPKIKGVGFCVIVTGLSVGSHTFKLQAKQAYVANPGKILSSAASKVHFSVVEI